MPGSFFSDPAHGRREQIILMPVTSRKAPKT